MDNRLKALIDQFIEAQHFVMRFMTTELGIDLPQHPLCGHLCSKPENRQKLRTAKVSVFPHGVGLRFHGKGLWIDFDFGDKGELGAFDAYRLHDFNKNNQLGIGFNTPDEIKREMQNAVDAGEIELFGHINYFLAPVKH